MINKKYLTLLIFFSMVGLCSGSFFEVFMEGVGKNQLIEILSSFFNEDQGQGFHFFLISSIKPIFLLWCFFFLCPIIPPLALLGPLICVLRAFTVGFSATMIIEAFGIKGCWYIIASIMPQGAIQLPVICLLTVISSNFALLMINFYLHKRNRKAQKNALHVNARPYVLINLICLAILVISCLFEAFLKQFLL